MPSSTKMSGLTPLWNVMDAFFYEDVRADAPLEYDGCLLLRRCQG
jgi:hypothetical protein